MPNRRFLLQNFGRCHGYVSPGVLDQLAVGFDDGAKTGEGKGLTDGDAAHTE